MKYSGYLKSQAVKTSEISFDVGQHSIKPWFCSGMTSWDFLTASPLAIYLRGKVEAEIRLLPPGEKANLQELQSSVA